MPGFYRLDTSRRASAEYGRFGAEVVRLLEQISLTVRGKIGDASLEKQFRTFRPRPAAGDHTCLFRMRKDDGLENDG